jgi:GTP-binding protein
VADIPGLIEGAHEGHGLGDQFLRHVERCSVLVHLVDLSTGEHPDVDAETIARELELYSPKLAGKPRIVVGSKLDSAIEGNSGRLRSYADRSGFPYMQISAVVGDGVRDLIRALAAIVKTHEHETRSVTDEEPLVASASDAEQSE